MMLYAINAETFGIATFSLTPDAIVEHDGVVYLLNATQVLELTGVNDDGVNIDSHILLGKISFNSDEEKRITRTYVKDQYANELLFTAILDELAADQTISETSYEYTISGHVGTRQHARGERLRSDLKAVDWAFKVANVDGGGMVLKGLSIDVEGIEIDME